MQYKNNAIFNLVQLLQFHFYFGKKNGRFDRFGEEFKGTRCLGSVELVFEKRL